MILSALFSWWYGAGWSRVAHTTTEQIDAVMEFFSVGLLARTLFDPFRQISAGQVRGSLPEQFRAWGDRTFSRVVGFVVRSMFIGIGCLGAVLVGLYGLGRLLLWPLLPVLPALGLIALAIGWTP
jgi:hypothetical protein